MVVFRGQKNRTRTKEQIPGNGGSQELFGPMFPWFCLFSLSFQWEEGQKFPGTLFLGTFLSYFRWFFSFRVFSRKKRQENGTDTEKLRRWQNSTNSCAVLFLVRKGPLGTAIVIRMLSRRRKRRKTNGEKQWIFGADFFAVYAELFTVYKGHKRWKENISLLMILFTVSFSRFAPSWCYFY